MAAPERAPRKGDGMPEFGAEAAPDAVAFDRLVALYEAPTGPRPREAAVAPFRKASPVPALTWRHLAAWPVNRLGEPVTTATGLAAAPLARYPDD